MCHRATQECLAFSDSERWLLDLIIYSVHPSVLQTTELKPRGGKGFAQSHAARLEAELGGDARSFLCGSGVRTCSLKRPGSSLSSFLLG